MIETGTFSFKPSASSLVKGNLAWLMLTEVHA